MTSFQLNKTIEVPGQDIQYFNFRFYPLKPYYYYYDYYQLRVRL